MFQFPGCPPHRLWIHLWVTGHDPRRVSPFGYLRFNVCLRLPAAFRSWPRPSSASGAKASALCFIRLIRLVLFFLRRAHSVLMKSWMFPLNLTLSLLLSSSLFALFVAIVQLSRCFFPELLLVGWSGLEPPTSRLSGGCSNQLSYQPTLVASPVARGFPLVEMSGFEPLASCLQGRRSPS